ncbi:hypothetical protein FN846DRAFT_775740 [Sphaerosporella brunnea]|uniref:Uncharacterized protein n=1 Tax=Sphaerosporella brunnea TaxID=1250544 RepID=A0A5J5F2Z3_9PEZI|nr:hypothetical protein FN846DRAFT_775740 [Sphaerosporella brunnea]
MDSLPPFSDYRGDEDAGPSSAKAKRPLPPFTDHADAEAGPSSSTPLLFDFDEPFAAPKAADEELPPYTEDPTYLGEEPPPFTTYTPRKHLLTNGKVVSHDAHLNSDVEALYQWLHSESQTPPLPLLQIEGTHRVRRAVYENGKTRTDTNTVTDFYLQFDLSTFLCEGYEVLTLPPTEKRRRGTRTAREATQAELEEALDVRGWCERYIRSPAQWKAFILRKRLASLDSQMLQTHVEAMIRSTNYRGHTRIRFPLENRSVVLSPDNWVCRIRYGWYRWIFYLSFLWLITWPVLWLFTKKWDVVEAVYQCRPNAERDWVDRWGWVLTRLVRQRRQQKCPLTVANLRWIECHELAANERLEARRASHGSGFWGFLRSLGDMGEAWEAFGGGWGADEW